MILVKKYNNIWKRWTGEVNLDVEKVKDLIETQIWKEKDYSPYGIKIAEEFIVPENKVSVGVERFEETNGKIYQIFDVVDYIEPIEVPQSITPLQARKALRITGLKNSVDNYISSLSEEKKEEWEYAIEIRRDNEIVLAGAQQLGITSEQLDNLFILGKTL